MSLRQTIAASPRLIPWLRALLVVAIAVGFAIPEASAADEVTSAAADEDDKKEKKKKRRKKRRKKKKKKKKKKDQTEAASEGTDGAAADEASTGGDDASTDSDGSSESSDVKSDEAAAEDAARAAGSDTDTEVKSVAATKKKKRSKRGALTSYDFDVRVDFSVISRESVGRVAGGLTLGFGLHPAVTLDARLAYGDGRGGPLEWLSTGVDFRVRPLRFSDDHNLFGSLVTVVGYEVFLGGDTFEKTALDFGLGVEYRTLSGANFVAVAGPALLFTDGVDFDDVFPRASIGFGHSF